jgi:hypothetical protein
MMRGDPAVVELIFGCVLCLGWCIVVMHLMGKQDGGA